jgi:outer membrane lipoprotein-sorting protein
LIRIIFLMLVPMCWSAVSLADPAPELAAAWDEIQSIRGEVMLRQKPDADVSHGFTAEGSAVWLKRNGRVLTRQMLRYEANDRSASYAITNLFDGEFQWMQRPGDEGMELFKLSRTPDPADFLAHFDWKIRFEELEKAAALEWRDDEVVNGAATHVLDVTPHDRAPDNPVLTTRSYFAKEYGIPIKAIAFDEHKRVVYEWTLSVTAVNAPVSPEIFVMTIPENAVVHDLTGAAHDR